MEARCGRVQGGWRRVRAVAEAGRYCDGRGLYLQESSGNRRWIQRLLIHGRRCELGLGGFPLVSLKEARDQAFVNRRVARAGGDPLAEKRRAKGTSTFADAAARVLEQKRAGWRNPKHAHDWPGSLVRFVSPRLGERPVSEIKQCRRARRARPHLAREAGDRPPGALAHRGGDAVVGGHGVPGRQPVRPRRRDARAPTRCRSAHASPAPCRGWLGPGDGPGVAGDHAGQARVRVPGAHRGPVRRGAVPHGTLSA